MLSTLNKIGEQLLEGKGIWARLTAEPKYSENKKNWICPILFDCDNRKIKILKDEMVLFKPEASVVYYRYITPSLWGPRGKKCALTVEIKNFSMLEETLFGKNSGDNGSMMRSIETYQEFKSEPIYYALKEINNQLYEQRGKLDLNDIKKELDLGKQDEVVLFYPLIKSDKLNDGVPIQLIHLEGYDDFVIAKFGTQTKGEKGIDHLSGEMSEEVIEAGFAGRYNIHKIFQTTASNYAAGFSDFKKNFQSSPNMLSNLDKSSQYVLNKLQTTIAGISHIIIPSFLHKDLDEFDINETELFLERSSDLLFRYNSLDADFEKELPNTEIFWINYLAFESDGNSFKIMNHIKDVNSEYLKKVIEVFNQTGIDFKPYIGDKYGFNLQAIYYIIPVRDANKSKNNAVLNLFKDVLEQTKIDSLQIFKHFAQFLICHRSNQFNDKKYHRSFSNIRENDSFDYAIKDAVFKYAALINALKQLKLLRMENEKPNAKLEEIQNLYPNEEIDEFLNLKSCNKRNQIALFCLGKALNVVGYAQERKKHTTRPILNKINYNGMEWEDFMDLSRGLLEKGLQYQTVKTKNGNVFQVRKKIEEWTDLFSKYAVPNNWDLSKEEAVFHLMAGYVFRPTSIPEESAE